MSSRLSRALSPFLVLSAVSLAACQVELSLGGAGASSSSGTGGEGGSGSSGEGGSGGSWSDAVTSTAGVTSGTGGWDPPEFTPDKVDLLLVVDNSVSMADKQEVMRLVLADFVDGLTNPLCVDPTGVAPGFRPPSGSSACPAGTLRVRTPVQDMHIGVISSSLGGHGSSACQGQTSASNVDMAHLLARSNEGVAENDLPTYQDKGFLVWDAAGSHVPAGDSDPAALAEKLSDIVQGVGQAGCGYEAPLESFYRFLVDPEPYETISVSPTHENIVLGGLDTTLLAQRKAFLRPDSLLLIVMLSDENDCSIREEGKNYLAAEVAAGFRMWRPRSECATNPNDPCCRNCSQQQDGCPHDPTCTDSHGNTARLTAAEDPVNSRCWDQKRRFGFDFLYPVERYTRALTEPWVVSRSGELVPNPIFSDLDPEDDNTRTRGPQHVMFTGIVGVPWQDLARQNALGEPDLLGGLNQFGQPVGGLKNAAELADPPSGTTLSSTWEAVLGDPANYILPADPLMIESAAPRSGDNPITGEPLVQPNANGWNGINGREYTIPLGSTGDLQYACIFPLAEERNCDGTAQSCDCRPIAGVPSDSPLCKPEGTNGPTDPGARSTTQDHAKAYPGLRELQLIRSLGERGVAGSICPAQLADPSSPDYGYRPIMNAVLDRLSTAL
ncbi:Putative secreted protein [Sorangium cellulosum So ce56]|uniref:Secreted protein n=1 Tax=Sorangium cellulosum (strain So ce56) TaxID=448385 RepID=A9FLA4_SORC5|nr:hypothetical protein [Sorangium cellulosum]CAN95194.1 Putative secreted protein [Sorangium cellulosum So ce56]